MLLVLVVLWRVGVIHFFATAKMVKWRKRGSNRVRNGGRVMNPEDLEKRWQQKSQDASKAIAQWRQEHPKATLAEIETAIDAQLDQVRAHIIEEVAQSETHQPTQQTPTFCPQCGEWMHQRGKHRRRLQTRGSQDVTLTRDYLSCPACGYSFFPPR